MNTMTYKGYSAGMEYDAEDEILVGRVMDVADIIVFHGASVAEFQAAFHQAIDDYLAACEKLDQAPDKPASGRLMLRIDPRIHASALRRAAREGLSLNKWAAKVLDQATRGRAGPNGSAG